MPIRSLVAIICLVFQSTLKFLKLQIFSKKKDNLDIFLNTFEMKDVIFFEFGFSELS